MPSNRETQRRQQQECRANATHRRHLNNRRREAVRSQPLLIDPSDSDGTASPCRAPIPPIPPAAQQWWDCVPQVLLHKWSPPMWTKTCHSCGARLLSSENSTFCCNNGERTTQVNQLPRLPGEMRGLLYDVRTSSVISGNSRRLNNLFAFTAIGFTGDRQNIPHDSHVAISGRSYH